MCFVDGYGEIVGLVIRAGMGVCLPFGYDSGGESGAGNRVFRSGRGGCVFQSGCDTVGSLGARRPGDVCSVPIGAWTGQEKSAEGICQRRRSGNGTRRDNEILTA